MSSLVPRVSVVVGACLVLAVGAPACAEETRVKLIAPWQGEGQLFQIEPGTVMFLGRFDGILYVEGGTGLFDGVPFVCPGTQVIDTARGTMKAEGYCMLVPSEDEEVYARWSCGGEVGECKGHLEFSGGTGRFAGIAGGGEMSVRTALSELDEDTRSGEVVRTAAGLAVWKELSYRLPGKK